MNENGKKWIKALRSGEFKQARSALGVEKDGVRTNCCLGVACELAMKDGVELEVEVLKYGSVAYNDRAVTSYVPDEVADWLGVKAADIARLSHMNDRGDSFERIADIIEADYYTEENRA